jgi:hypothetical protein
MELSRGFSGYFKPLPDPGGGFTSKTAARRFQNLNGRYVTVSLVERLQFYNGYIYVAAILQRTQVSVRL